MAEYKTIPIELIDEPELPVRAQMDEQALEELAADIRLNGIIEPLVVSLVDGRYAIWAGHRRYLAARKAYLEQLPCMVYTAGELPREAVMLSENICREDLTAAEQGWFILELVEKLKLSMDDLTRRLRRSENWINERVDLVQKDATVAQAVAQRFISHAVAKELLKCGDEDHRRYLLKLAIEHGCTARTIAYQVAQYKQQQQQPLAPAAAAAPSTSAAPPPDLTPHCVLCGMKDSPENLVQKNVHWYHWDPIKKFLRDASIEVHD